MVSLKPGLGSASAAVGSAAALDATSVPISSPSSRVLDCFSSSFAITFTLTLTDLLEPSAKLISTAIVCFPGLDVSISALGFTLASAGRFVIASL